MGRSSDNSARNRLLLTSDIPPATSLAKGMHDARNRLMVLSFALNGRRHYSSSNSEKEDVDKLLVRLDRIRETTTFLLEQSQEENMNIELVSSLLRESRGQLKKILNDSYPYIKEEWVDDSIESVHDFEKILNESYENLVYKDAESPNAAENEVELMKLSECLPKMIGEYQRAYPHIDFSILASPTASDSEFPSDMKRVLENLILNAVQAAPASGGRITVVMECREIQETQKPFADIEDGIYLSIEIEDNGSGISTDVMGHLKYESYTTKPQGSGIGLISARSSMRAHNSHLYIESEEGSGTKVTALIPSSLPSKPRTISGVRKKATLKKS